jgi:hypothetical protein
MGLVIVGKRIAESSGDFQEKDSYEWEINKKYRISVNKCGPGCLWAAGLLQNSSDISVLVDTTKARLGNVDRLQD